jgi:glycosyltransferase involved in cell wall biosynthesis
MTSVLQQGAVPNRLLLITDRPPLPPDAGDRQRSALLFAAMQRIAPTDLLLLLDPASLPRGADDESVGKTEQTLREQFNLIECVRPAARGEKGFWRLFRPIHPRLVDRAAHNLGKRGVNYAPDRLAQSAFRHALERRSYTAVVGRYLLPTVKSGALSQIGRRLPVVLDVDDLDTEVYRTRLGVPDLPGWKRAVVRRHLHQLERIVAELLPKFDHLWVPSRTDVALVEPFNARVSVLPNVPYSIPDHPASNAADTGNVLVTVGSWTHRVNVEGVDHFIGKHWPAIRKLRRDAIYRLIGSGMSEGLRARWGSVAGVEPIGRVDDLNEAYARATAAIVPLYEGGGSKIKVLESLGFGRAAVVTPHALRGYEHVLKDRESIFVVERDADFASACVEVLANARLRNSVAARGRALVLQHFTSEVAAGEVRKTLESLCPVLAPARSA